MLLFSISGIAPILDLTCHHHRANGKAHSLEGISHCPGWGLDQLEIHLGFFRCFLALLPGILGPVLVLHAHTALQGAT